MCPVSVAAHLRATRRWRAHDPSLTWGRPATAGSAFLFWAHFPRRPEGPHEDCCRHADRASDAAPRRWGDTAEVETATTGLGGRCTRRQGRRGRSGDPGRLLPASAARTCSRRRTSPPSSDRRSAYTCSPGLLWRPEPWRRPTRPCASVRAAPGTRPSGRPEPSM